MNKKTGIKKGNIFVIIIIIGALFLLMFIGLALVIGSAITNYVADIVVPEISNLGMAGGANLTEAADFTITPVDIFIQNFTWVAGIIYIFGIIGIFGLAFVYRNTGEKWLIGFYVALVLILVIASIFISNIYEEFYTGTDDLSIRLQEHTLLSWLLLYSPMVVSLIAFLAGIILFSGSQEGFI